MKSHNHTAAKSYHTPLLVACSVALTVGLGTVGRADVWVTVDPAGAVTRSEAPAARKAPEVAAQVAGNTYSTGLPAQVGSAAPNQTWGAVPQTQYGVGYNTVTDQTYSGVYAPVAPPVGGYYPQPYPQYYYPPSYYPDYYYVQPQGYIPVAPVYDGPYRVELSGGASITRFTTGRSGYYGPVIVYPQGGSYGCNVCHRNSCGGHGGGHNHQGNYNRGNDNRRDNYNGVYMGGGGYNGVYNSRTTVSPSANISIGSRGTQVNINTGRTTTNSTVINNRAIR